MRRVPSWQGLPHRLRVSGDRRPRSSSLGLLLLLLMLHLVLLQGAAGATRRGGRSAAGRRRRKGGAVGGQVRDIRRPGESLPRRARKPKGRRGGRRGGPRRDRAEEARPLEVRRRHRRRVVRFGERQCRGAGRDRGARHRRRCRREGGRRPAPGPQRPRRQGGRRCDHREHKARGRPRRSCRGSTRRLSRIWPERPSRVLLEHLVVLGVGDGHAARDRVEQHERGQQEHQRREALAGLQHQVEQWPASVRRAFGRAPFGVADRRDGGGAGPSQHELDAGDCKGQSVREPDAARLHRRDRRARSPTGPRQRGKCAPLLPSGRQGRRLLGN
mmetsp:Transcript_63589/g.177975  ORF Transcript_63589/g.177975 Transcript_63589/m.177975 type:complete len:329 (+) Transcript_63589:540-1526(+)